MQFQPWTSEVITTWGPGCSHIAFCMIANHMHVYSVVLPGMLVHKLLTELLLDVAVTICLSMLAYQQMQLCMCSATHKKMNGICSKQAESVQLRWFVCLSLFGSLMAPPFRKLVLA